MLYHDEAAWSGGNHFADMIDAAKALAPYTPDFPFGLCDLSQTQLDELQARAWLALVLTVLKYSRSGE